MGRVAELGSLGITRMSHSIDIRSRGEELVYRDSDGEFHFDVSSDGSRVTVHCSSYWDGVLGSSPVSLPLAKSEQIVPRIREFFAKRGETVEVACYTPEHGLPSRYTKRDA